MRWRSIRQPQDNRSVLTADLREISSSPSAYAVRGLFSYSVSVVSSDAESVLCHLRGHVRLDNHLGPYVWLSRSGRLGRVGGTPGPLLELNSQSGQYCWRVLRFRCRQISVSGGAAVDFDGFLSACVGGIPCPKQLWLAFLKDQCLSYGVFSSYCMCSKLCVWNYYSVPSCGAKCDLIFSKISPNFGQNL